MLRPSRRWWIPLTGLVAIAMLATIAWTLWPDSSSDQDRGGATGADEPSSTSDKLLDALAAIPASVFTEVGPGAVVAPPGKITDAPLLTKGGKPLVVYIGAEYCPFCAAQRWPLIIALSRFGTFADVTLTHSASDDVFPDTQTFTFHGSSYTSDALAFVGVEQATNVKVGDDYGVLQRPTQWQRELMNTYNRPPYVQARSTTSIPFLDFGNRHVINGASYLPKILAGKTHQQILDLLLTQPSHEITQAIIGTANMITALLCSLTSNKPATICETRIVAAWQSALR